MKHYKISRRFMLTKQQLQQEITIKLGIGTINVVDKFH